MAYGNRAPRLFQARLRQRAIEDYTAQIEIAPDVMAYLARGNVYRDTEQLDRAIADYGE